jgi:uncharacterized protein (TIGR03437 family)
LAAALCATATQAQNNPTYRFITNLGNIDVALTPGVAPKTVANFLSYVNAGYYNNTIFHRSVPGFVVQAGGYQYLPTQTPNVVAVPQSPAIQNEFSNVTNAAGTIAMALVSGNTNSATSQWFFNLVDNGSQLDSQSFTVFGRTNAAGISVLNRIAAQPVFDYSATYGGDFSTLPLSGGQTGTFIVVQSIVPVPSITSGGFQSAASFASNSLTGISPGEILTIYGQGMGPSQLATFALPASGPVATNLAGTQVFFNGQAAPLIYTSNGQISVIAPYTIGDLPTVSVSVSYNGIQSGSLNFPVKPANPAIFTLDVSGSGDGVIVKYQGSSYTIISASSPASAGDILTLFGEGYGAATIGSAVPDGSIVTTTLPVPANPTTLLMDGNPVSTSYVGGAPYEINGVLQVNFTVPQLSPGSHKIQLKVSTPTGDRISPASVTIQTK